jgi:hypothetical protein
MSALLKIETGKLTSYAKSTWDVQIANRNWRSAPNASGKLCPERGGGVETDASNKVHHQVEDVRPELSGKELVSQERVLCSFPLPQAVSDESADAGDQIPQSPLIRPWVSPTKGDANKEEDDAGSLKKDANPVNLGKCLGLGAVSKTLAGFGLAVISADQKVIRSGTYRVVPKV